MFRSLVWTTAIVGMALKNHGGKKSFAVYASEKKCTGSLETLLDGIDEQNIPYEKISKWIEKGNMHHNLYSFLRDAPPDVAKNVMDTKSNLYQPELRKIIRSFAYGNFETYVKLLNYLDQNQINTPIYGSGTTVTLTDKLFETMCTNTNNYEDYFPYLHKLLQHGGKITDVYFQSYSISKLPDNVVGIIYESLDPKQKFQMLEGFIEFSDLRRLEKFISHDVEINSGYAVFGRNLLEYAIAHYFNCDINDTDKKDKYFQIIQFLKKKGGKIVEVYRCKIYPKSHFYYYDDDDVRKIFSSENKDVQFQLLGELASYHRTEIFAEFMEHFGDELMYTRIDTRNLLDIVISSFPCITVGYDEKTNTYIPNEVSKKQMEEHDKIINMVLDRGLVIWNAIETPYSIPNPTIDRIVTSAQQDKILDLLIKFVSVGDSDKVKRYMNYLEDTDNKLILLGYAKKAHLEYSNMIDSKYNHFPIPYLNKKIQQCSEIEGFLENYPSRVIDNK